MNVQFVVEGDLYCRQIRVDEFDELGTIAMRLEPDLAEAEQTAQNGESADAVLGEEVVRRQEGNVEEEADLQVLVQTLHNHAGQHQVV